jgi:hypothetical protein
MATDNEPAKISCPCCQATLVIDRETLAILYVTEHRVKAGGASFEKSLQDLKDKEKQKSSRFQQAFEEEKQQPGPARQKISELRKQADTNPDDRPLRPFDLTECAPSMADGSAALRQEQPSRYRYAVLLIGFVTLAGASGVSGCFAVFYNTLVTAFSWSRASGASPYSVNMLVSIVSAPLIGWLLDRYGPRFVFTSAALLSGGALMACSTLQTLGHFVVYYGVLSAVGQTALGSVAVVVSRWFERTQRGRAIGFADVGTGFGMVVFIPGSAWLIETLGWRPAFTILGAVIMILLVPLNLWQRRPPVASVHGQRRELWTRFAPKHSGCSVAIIYDHHDDHGQRASRPLSGRLWPPGTRALLGVER